MRKKQAPIYAPGQENVLNQEASKRDKKTGNLTKVTKLSYDEVDPG